MKTAERASSLNQVPAGDCDVMDVVRWGKDDGLFLVLDQNEHCTKIAHIGGEASGHWTVIAKGVSVKLVTHLPLLLVS